MLEIDRDFDHWSILTRFQWGNKGNDWKLKGAPAQEIKFADLGLGADREYLVFEFWSQTFLGQFKGAFTAPALDQNTGMQTFVVRTARPHPWVLSTTRHISQGGVSLQGVKWDGAQQTLSGKSSVVANDPYVLSIHLPDGFRVKSAQMDGKPVETKSIKGIATVKILPTSTKTIDWKIVVEK